MTTDMFIFLVVSLLVGASPCRASSRYQGYGEAHEESHEDVLHHEYEGYLHGRQVAYHGYGLSQSLDGNALGAVERLKGLDAG